MSPISKSMIATTGRIVINFDSEPKRSPFALDMVRAKSSLMK